MPLNGSVHGVVVTYFPSYDIVARLREIAAVVDELVVVDNGSSTEQSALLLQGASTIGYRLVSNGNNLGVATALNQGVRLAQSNGAAWVVFFDQDSDPAKQFRSEIDRILHRYSGERPLGIVGCNHFLVGSLKPRFPDADPEDTGYVEVSAVITSGSVYAMSMLSRLGPLRDEYFIDCVDTEYCWRALANGYAVCRTTKPLITHSIGSPESCRILWRSLTSFNHSPMRRYFIGRNNVLLFREYFVRRPKDSIDLLGYVLKTALKICLVEQGKRTKLACLFVGIWHGLHRRTGANPWQPQG